MTAHLNYQRRRREDRARWSKVDVLSPFPAKPLPPGKGNIRIFRSGQWFTGRSLEKVREKDGYLKVDIRIGWSNIRTYVKPEHVEALRDDWICLTCGRINGKDYSNCNGCGKGRP